MSHNCGRSMAVVLVPQLHLTILSAAPAHVFTNPLSFLPVIKHIGLVPIDTRVHHKKAAQIIHNRLRGNTHQMKTYPSLNQRSWGELFQKVKSVHAASMTDLRGSEAGCRRAALAWYCNTSMYVASTPVAIKTFDDGHVMWMIEVLLQAGPENAIFRRQDPYIEHGLLMGIVSKCLRHLSGDRLMQVLDSAYPAYLVECMDLLVSAKDAECQPRTAVQVGLSVMCMAVLPHGREVLLQAGALRALPKLRDSSYHDAGREMSTYTSSAHALLVGREESANAGLTAKDMDRVVSVLKNVLSMKSSDKAATYAAEGVAAANEISVSDRHLMMLLEADVLDVFPLLSDPDLHDYYATTWKVPVFNGKMMDVHVVETVVGIALHAALLPEGQLVLKANSAAIETLRVLTNLDLDLDGRLDWKQSQNQAALVLSLIGDETTTEQKIKARRSSLRTDDFSELLLKSSPSPLPPTKKHVMISYSWAQQAGVLRVATELKARGFTLWVDVEQMQGCTIDAMASAVENAAVVLVCVSKEYKESVNCKYEAGGINNPPHFSPEVCLRMQIGCPVQSLLWLLLLSVYADMRSADDVLYIRRPTTSYSNGFRISS